MSMSKCNNCIDCNKPLASNKPSYKSKKCLKCAKKYFSKEYRLKLRESKLGSKNPRWTGDNVSYTGIHLWGNRNIIKPELCNMCKKSAPYDLANISQEYKRDVSDWEWLCRKCHMIKDGRINKLGLYPLPGEFNGRAKANWKMVNKIREEIKTGVTQVYLANKYNLSKTTIYRIVNVFSWKN